MKSMSPEPPALEQTVGLSRYLSTTPGIGGRIKLHPEDFLVHELSTIPHDPEGEHVVFTLRKRNWDTMGAIVHIAKVLGLPQKAFGFAGNKDRHAITEQKISVHAVDPDHLASLVIPGIEIKDVFRTRKKVRLGMLRGNRFTIIVRSIPEELDTNDRIVTIHEELAGRVPNYLGVQRFGASRPNNHLVGRALVQGNVKGALAEFLWHDHPEEGSRSREARRMLAEEQDLKKAARTFPRGLSYERMVLRELARGRRPEAALHALPKPLRRLLVHAYQGYIFNRILSARMDRGLPIDVPVEGDIVLIGWKTIPVDAENIDRLTTICSAGKGSISLPLPGSESVLAEGEPGEMERAIIAEEGIDLSRFASCIVPSKGTRRAAAIHYDAFSVEPGPEDDTVTFAFDLRKGAYATCVIREFTKGQVW